MLLAVALALALALALAAGWLTAKRASVIAAQHYNCNVGNPGQRLGTRRMVFASRTGSRDTVRDRYLCIAVWRSELLRR